MRTVIEGVLGQDLHPLRAEPRVVVALARLGEIVAALFSLHLLVGLRSSC